MESSFYNLYQTVLQFSNQFKNPYLKQITREPKSVTNFTSKKIDIKNYLLKRPIEGRAFLPEGASNNRTMNDLSFIPIEKMIVEEPKPFKQNEELFEISKSTNLFIVDTKPLHIEDMGEPLERKTKTLKNPLRYYGLKIKKIKPNPSRKNKNEENKEKQ